ncbi:FecR domain-containing protein [Echinicola jeungdonensis]|uniref:FecR family protein n=1 Tax=Echinicola jeungdonensis TaxID=709343 RepID=A0ABV5J3H5_9BACT|nr:FecR family protein [Echinicola jeungdonensis]MDN3670702.1 FecR domain-containing protein [Echinicola jeungdonensis]
MKDRKEELLTNPEFVRWVRNPDAALDAYWQKWLKANPHRRDELLLAREILKGLKKETTSSQLEEKENILNNILSQSPEVKVSKNTPEKPGKGTPIRILTQVSRIAAIILLAVALSWMTNYFLNQGQQDIPAQIATLSKETPFGEKLKFKLPDGTIVWLNSGSKISYPEKFSENQRQVHLEGEGFFDVAENPNKPFKVVSGELTTIALGTSFNISHMGNNKLDIALLTGKVKIQNSQTRENILLVPGQELKYIPNEGKTNVGNFDPIEVAGWKDGILSFKNADVQEVIQKLERWYGINISTSGQPKRNWNLTGKYKNESLKIVLERIAYVENFQYSQKDKQVIIKF